MYTELKNGERIFFLVFGNYFCNEEDEIKMETLTFVYMVWEI
jgi:hypothetical protein